MNLGRSGLESLKPFVEYRRCATEVSAGYAERVEDVMIWRSRCEVEGIVAEGGKDGINILCDSYEWKFEKRFGLCLLYHRGNKSL